MGSNYRDKFKKESKGSFVEKSQGEVSGFKLSKDHTYTQKDHHILRNLQHVHKVTGTDITGRTAWYIVLINPAKEAAFLKHTVGSSYNLEDYGEILASGYGDDIDIFTKYEFRSKYGMDNL